MITQLGPFSGSKGRSPTRKVETHSSTAITHGNMRLSRSLEKQKRPRFPWALSSRPCAFSREAGGAVVGAILSEITCCATCEDRETQKRPRFPLGASLPNSATFPRSRLWRFSIYDALSRSCQLIASSPSRNRCIWRSRCGRLPCQIG